MHAPLLTDGMRDRLERCSAAFHARRLELLRDRPGNRCGVEVRRFTDHVVATAAAGASEADWMQHVIGLRPGDEPLVPTIAAWYHDLGLRPRFEIAPAAGFEPLAAALAGARARQTGFIDTLWGRSEVSAGGASTDVEIRVVEPGSGDAALFAQVLLGGHGVPDDALPEHWDAIAVWPDEPGWRCYLGLVDGDAAGAAALAIGDGIGFLANASTLPAGRRRGCQQALIDRRLRDAAGAGCDLTMSLAVPGLTSHRNLERAGLGSAYTNVFWTVLEP